MNWFPRHLRIWYILKPQRNPKPISENPQRHLWWSTCGAWGSVAEMLACEAPGHRVRVCDQLVVGYFFSIFSYHLISTFYESCTITILLCCLNLIYLLHFMPSNPVPNQVRSSQQHSTWFDVFAKCSVCVAFDAMTGWSWPIYSTYQQCSAGGACNFVTWHGALLWFVGTKMSSQRRMSTFFFMWVHHWWCRFDWGN